MSMDEKPGYYSPRVEDVFSEAGDRPPNNFLSSTRQPPHLFCSVAGAKVAAARSASDSGYSSRTGGTTSSSPLNGSVKDDQKIKVQDVQEEDTRRPMPYNNTHRRGHESLTATPKKDAPGLSGTKKAKPKPISTRSEPGAMAPPPPPSANYQRPYARQQQRPLPIRVNTINTAYAIPPAAMVPPPTPYTYQQQPSPVYSSAGFQRFSPHPNTALPPTHHQAHVPIYGPQQPTQQLYHQSLQQPYTNAHPTYTPPQPPYPQTSYTAYAPVPPAGFAMPVHQQRPPLPTSRHTAPVQSQGLPQPLLQYMPVGNSRDPQALSVHPVRRQRHVKDLAQRPRVKQKAHRHYRSRAQESESDSESESESESDVSSTHSSSSSSSSSDGRASPRKALQKARSTGTTRDHPSKSKRRESYASNRYAQDEEKLRLLAMESYQRETATPPRRQTGAPRYIEDTARATKAASPRHSEDSPSPQSPTRSRTSASYSDVRSRRDSLIVSTKGPFTYRQTEDGQHSFEALEGQEMTLTINGKEQRREKGSVGEGSNSNAGQSHRRGSLASTTRTEGSSSVRKGRDTHGAGKRRTGRVDE